MPNVAWNAQFWGTDYSWPKSGEEWSRKWGGSEPQWFGSLYPRLHRFLPAGRILEIAPGHGRWTKFLIPACTEYLGIDLNESCIEVCRRRFADAAHAKFIANDGVSLNAVPDGQYDLIFSFDSLVHAEIDVFQSYVPQIIHKLAPGGVAFLHHSNLAEAALEEGQPHHWRGVSMSGTALSAIIAQSGGAVVVQEVINWRDTGLIDCLTTFARAGAFAAAPVVLSNHRFMNEANIIKTFQSAYSAIRSAS